jgi:hypothetical protein
MRIVGCFRRTEGGGRRTEDGGRRTEDGKVGDAVFRLPAIGRNTTKKDGGGKVEDGG